MLPLYSTRRQPLRRFSCQILVIAVLCLALPGCNENADRRQTQDSASPAESKGQPSDRIRLDLRRGSENRSEEGDASSPERLFGPTEFLLPSGEIGAAVPSDFVIGALSAQAVGPSGEGKTGATISRLIEEFFGSSELREELVLPSERRRLGRRFSGSWRSVQSVRVGRIAMMEDARAQAPVRLLDGRARAAGEVYLQNEDGKWYISDVLVDLSRLREPAQPRSFQPGGPRPGLTGP